MTDSRDKLRTDILRELVALVPFDGWNGSTLERAAYLVASDRTAARRAFPEGIAEAVDFYLSETDRAMSEALAARDITSLKIRERITLAVRTRLELVAPEREAVRRASAFLLMPQNLALSVKATWRTVDAMWFAAGDRAMDASYYTKRLLLAKVYGSTLLFWLSDDSPHHEDSWAFLDRRIEGVMQFQKWKGTLQKEWQRWTSSLSPAGARR